MGQEIGQEIQRTVQLRCEFILATSSNYNRVKGKPWTGRHLTSMYLFASQRMTSHSGVKERHFIRKKRSSRTIFIVCTSDSLESKRSQKKRGWA